ncbi:MAG: 2-polyprenyl-6-methoxyphenol hydroxylase-like FAD-dependent oxidoreductase [Halocynthiibacter sp.]|jgi:2-polyprenyl-6-methoxyphenol hydroxylase-like FAD-dependent oxidoreductase
MSNQWRQGKRVAIIGAGPGGISTALEMINQGYDVRIFERRSEVTPFGGAVLLSVPVLAVLRHYGVDIGEKFGSMTVTEFRNNKGAVRSRLPFNKEVEKSLGIPGWHYGVLRSSAFARMMERLPEGVICPDHGFDRYEERGDEVIITFEDGTEVAADLLIGADGVHSRVSKQLFGTPDLFHIGLRVWLAWCEDKGDLDRGIGAIHHSRDVQASFFPMLHDGKPGFEWWIVETSNEGEEPPADIEAHVRGLLSNFADPMPRFPDRTDFDSQIFRWEIYNRTSLKSWSRGRVACVGDAVHPVSPYAAYGMGMAIEDGYFLARAFKGGALGDRSVIDAACARYEADRVDYCNHHVEFARKLGNQFHKASKPVAWLRDLVFDNTKLLHKMIQKEYLADAEKLSIQLKELHVE